MRGSGLISLLRMTLVFFMTSFMSFRASGDPTTRNVRDGREVFNVMTEGAAGDGMTDDGEAFQRAWKQACRTPSAVVYVPAEEKFFLRPAVFKGPCASNLVLQVYWASMSIMSLPASLNFGECASLHSQLVTFIDDNQRSRVVFQIFINADRESDWSFTVNEFLVEGTIVAMDGPGSGTGKRTAWLQFKNLIDFSLVGTGRINGKGNRWWNQVCRPTMKNCKPGAEDPPNGLVFQNCMNVRVSNLRIRDSPKFHLTFTNCDGVFATGLLITAPRNSPNTDGIHLKNSRNVFILNCRIRSGDDCVSIQTGSNRVLIEDIMCGPGHGISVGSLGKSGSRACVWGVRVERATFDRTTNGFRIKTWQGGSGHAHGMRFVNARMNEVENPVVIDQYYCDSPFPCANKTSAVAVSEIIIANITGTSSSSMAVGIKCSDHVPCRNIVLENITVETESDKNERTSEFSCWNAYGFVINISDPMSCDLLPHPTDDGLLNSIWISEKKVYQLPEGC